MNKTKFSINKEGLVNNTELFNDDHSTQQYVRSAVHTTLEELGFMIDEEWEMDDDSIQITAVENKVVYRGTANPNATNSELDAKVVITYD